MPGDVDVAISSELCETSVHEFLLSSTRPLAIGEATSYPLGCPLIHSIVGYHTRTTVLYVPLVWHGVVYTRMHRSKPIAVTWSIVTPLNVKEKVATT